jgi:hypothetical protein
MQCFLQAACRSIYRPALLLPLIAGGLTTIIGPASAQSTAALAALMPMTLTTTQVSDSVFGVTFDGENSKLAYGAQGTLSIKAPNDRALAVDGAHTSYGTSTSSGKIARYTLFPPSPTSWTVIDAAHHTKFTIAMAAGTSHSYNGKIKKTTDGTVLATFHVDETGTGSITYSDNSTAKVIAWTLAN